MNSLSRGVIRRSHRVVGGLGRASGWHGEPADCDGRMFELRRRSTRFRVQLKALCARKNGLLLASSGKDKPLHQGLGTTHTHSLWCVLCLYVCMSVCMCVCVYVHVCVCVSACVRPWSHLKSLCFPHNFPKHFVLCHATGDPPGCAVVMRGWALAKVLLSSGNSTKLLNIR